MSAAVQLEARARGAAGLQVSALPIGAVVIGDAGEVLVVRRDGGLDLVPPPGHPRPGIAADPAARSSRCA